MPNLLPLNTNKKVLFIDPGLGGTGWAFFETLSAHPPTEWGVIKRDRGEWTTRVKEIVKALAHVPQPHYLVIEMPGLWAGNSVSQAAATTGDLFKLAFLVGAICQCSDLPTTLISPQQWKGQMPKQLVIRRIIKRFPHLDAINNHEADAIGMGLSCQGLL